MRSYTPRLPVRHRLGVPGRLRASGGHGREPGDALSRAAGTGPPCQDDVSIPGRPVARLAAGSQRRGSSQAAACLSVPGRYLPATRQARRGARARGVLSGLGDESLAVTGTAGVKPAGGAAARRGA
jgi:hypothetical protein